MNRMSKAKKDELEKKAQITGSWLYEYLSIENSLPLTQELVSLLANKGFSILTIGQSCISETFDINHLRLIKGDNELEANERIFLTIHKRKTI